MLLIVTNKGDYTADFFILHLRERKLNYVRLNTEDYPEYISICLRPHDDEFPGSYFEIYGRKIYFREVKSVWYRRPLPPEPAAHLDEIARQFVVHESTHVLESVWRMLDCNWVSHPDKIRIAESKPFQLMIASRLGFRIPNTVITNQPDQARRFIDEQERTVYKPMRFRQVDRSEEASIGLIFTNVLDDQDIERLDEIELAPVLLQNYVHKAAELRVTVVGTWVFAVRLESQLHPDAINDWRRPDVREISHVAVNLPTDIHNLCIALVQQLGLKFGAIDLILMPNGNYVFLEINPTGQWAWIEQMLPEIGISHALASLLMEAG